MVSNYSKIDWNNSNRTIPQTTLTNLLVLIPKIKFWWIYRNHRHVRNVWRFLKFLTSSMRILTMIISLSIWINYVLLPGQEFHKLKRDSDAKHGSYYWTTYRLIEDSEMKCWTGREKNTRKLSEIILETLVRKVF
jgi:hypothetical protein